jgi:hypothetical protein
VGAIFLINLSRENIRHNYHSVLEIADTFSGRVYDRRIIQSSGTFAVEFIHSVNNSPVIEFFIINGKEIQNTAVHFNSFGAGMLTELEEGQTMIMDDGTLVITGLNRTFTELNYIIAEISDHILIINEERISLTSLCGINAHITLRIR